VIVSAQAQDVYGQGSEFATVTRDVKVAKR
jgi:hypothetical protein